MKSLSNDHNVKKFAEIFRFAVLEANRAFNEYVKGIIFSVASIETPASKLCKLNVLACLLFPKDETTLCKFGNQ